MGMGDRQFASHGETGIMGKETTMMTKETEQNNETPMDGGDNGYDNEMGGDALSEYSSFTAHSIDSDSEVSKSDRRDKEGRIFGNRYISQNEVALL